MHRGPKDRTALDGQVTADRDKVLQPFRHRKSPVGKKAVISQSQSQARDGVEDQKSGDGRTRVEVKRKNARRDRSGYIDSGKWNVQPGLVPLGVLQADACFCFVHDASNVIGIC
jgi:hypothetical protein